MGELPGRNVAKTGKGKNWKSRGRGKEKNMVVEYIPLCDKGKQQEISFLKISVFDEFRGPLKGALRTVGLHYDI